jgi:hypothetical protein
MVPLCLASGCTSIKQRQREINSVICQSGKQNIPRKILGFLRTLENERGNSMMAHVKLKSFRNIWFREVQKCGQNGGAGQPILLSADKTQSPKKQQERMQCYGRD